MRGYLEKYFWLIAVGLLLIIFIIENILIVKFHSTDTHQEVDLASVALSEEVKEANTFWVEIKGEVNKPGIYEVNAETILNDLINQAQGFTKNAYTNNLNLSQKLTAQMVIKVYSEKEYQKFKVSDPYFKCYVPSYDITSCIEKGASVILTSDEASVEISNTQNVVNINTADAKTLMSLTGIGEAKAEKIILYRNNNGLFKTIEEIKKVSGIGEALFNQIKNDITV